MPGAGDLKMVWKLSEYLPVPAPVSDVLYLLM